MDNSIFITARYDGDGFEKYLGPSLQQIKTKCVNVADKKDSTDVKSIANKYNIGTNIITDNELLNNDTMVIYAKSSVHVIDPMAVNKVAIAFDSMPQIGVIGVLGVKEIHRGRALYNPDNKPVNGIMFKQDGSNNVAEHIQYSENGFYDDVVAIDDSFIAIRGSALLNGLRWHTDINRGVGLEIAINALRMGYEVAVADILVLTHEPTELHHTEIESVLDQINVSIPVNIKNVAVKSNSVVDIEI